MRSKKKKILILIGILLVLTGTILFLIFSGFFVNEEQSGQTIAEPEITPEYLKGEYAEMLIRDGALITVGTLEEIKSSTSIENSFEAVVHGKEVVESESEPGGYYIADLNTALPVFIDQQTRIVVDDKILSTDEFVNSHNSLLAALIDAEQVSDSEKETLDEEELKDLEDTIASGSKNYYSIYTIGTQTLLITTFEYSANSEEE